MADPEPARSDPAQVIAWAQPQRRKQGAGGLRVTAQCPRLAWASLEMDYPVTVSPHREMHPVQAGPVSLQFRPYSTEAPGPAIRKLCDQIDSLLVLIVSTNSVAPISISTPSPILV